jgi:hypothetical protein
MENLTAPYNHLIISRFKEGNMNELHLRQPIWLGDRTEIHVGIAHFRLVDDYGRPRKGNIRVWVDWKVKDKNSPDENAMVLAYTYPFVISCAKAITYPTQVLTDVHRTMLHIIPLEHLKVQKTRRKRTMSQEDFKVITDLARRLK